MSYPGSIIEDKFFCKKGFSAFELLISIVITFLVINAAITLDINYNMIYLVGTSHLGMQMDARITLDWLVADARWASQIEKVFGSYTSTTTCVILRVPSIDNAGLVINDTFDRIIYRINGSNLERIVIINAASSRASGTRVLSRNCSNFTLRAASGGTLFSSLTTAQLEALASFNVSATISRTISPIQTRSQTINETLTETIRLRNR